MLATAGADGTIRFWKTSSRRLLRSWEGKSERVFSLSFSPDATFLASGTAEGTLIVKNVKTAEVKFQQSFPAKVQAIRYSPDGSALAIALSDTWVGTCDARTGAIRFGKRLRGSLALELYPMVLKYFPDGKRFATIRGGQIQTMDTASGEKLGRFEGALHVSTFDISPDGSRVAGVRQLNKKVGGKKIHEMREIMFWDSASRKFANSIENPVPVSGVAFSPDGTLLAAGGTDGTVTLWDLKAGSRRTVKMVSSTPVPSGLGFPVSLSTLAFSPDGKLLAGGGPRGRIDLFDLGSGNVAALDEGSPDDPYKVRIASACVGSPHLMPNGSWADQVIVESGACPVIDGEYQNAGGKFTRAKHDTFECTTASLAHLLNSWDDSQLRQADKRLGLTSPDPAKDPYQTVSLRFLDGKLHVEASVADGSTRAFDLPTRQRCRDSTLLLEADWDDSPDPAVLRLTLALGRSEDGSLLVRDSQWGVVFFLVPIPFFGLAEWTRFPPVAPVPTRPSGPTP